MLLKCLPTPPGTGDEGEGRVVAGWTLLKFTFSLPPHPSTPLPRLGSSVSVA